MPDPTDPSDPTESTEARLCAYLEGTLSPADRTEIEAYLARSPEHQALLADLATTRKWLNELPRVPAPPEIAELFDSQIERNMLLDDSSSPVGIRLYRGPQALLAVAVVLLALGLGAIIYLVLMVRGPTAQNYAASMRPVPPLPMPAPLGAVRRLADAPTTARLLDGTIGSAAGLPAAPPTASELAKGAATTAPMRSAVVTMSAVRFQAPASILPAMPVAVTRPTTAAAGFPSTSPATTQPGFVAVGDRLSVDIPQLIGPGVEKTTTIRVEPDGNVTLPMLDPMPAAGKTLADLQTQIADRYRQEHLITAPVVTVSRLPMPTTRPTTRSVAAATMPSTRPIP